MNCNLFLFFTDSGTSVSFSPPATIPGAQLNWDNEASQLVKRRAEEIANNSELAQEVLLITNKYLYFRRKPTSKYLEPTSNYN